MDKSPEVALADLTVTFRENERLIRLQATEIDTLRVEKDTLKERLERVEQELAQVRLDPIPLQAAESNKFLVTFTLDVHRSNSISIQAMRLPVNSDYQLSERIASEKNCVLSYFVEAPTAKDALKELIMHLIFCHQFQPTSDYREKTIKMYTKGVGRFDTHNPSIIVIKPTNDYEDRGPQS